MIIFQTSVEERLTRTGHLESPTFDAQASRLYFSFFFFFLIYPPVDGEKQSFIRKLTTFPAWYLFTCTSPCQYNSNAFFAITTLSFI